MRRRALNPISQLPEHWQKWYQQWDAKVPDNKGKRGLKGQLLDQPGSQQSYSAAFELFLFQIFDRMGMVVDFQPQVNGVNPDFWISDERGRSAYVEAGAMFSDPFEAQLSYACLEMPIWEAFKKLRSPDFTIKFASSSGCPGNVRAQQVSREVQEWLNQLTAIEVRRRLHYPHLLHKTFQFGDWRLEVGLDLKSAEDKDRLGEMSVDVVGFSHAWADASAERLKSKVKEKASQVRRAGGSSVVAIAGRTELFSPDDIQTALFGGNRDCILSPGEASLAIPQPNADGLWAAHDAKEPIAVMLHRGDLRHPDIGETELWLNPKGNYFGVPLPLLGLKVNSMIQKVWTRPATGP